MQNNSSIYDAVIQLSKQYNEQIQEIREKVNSLRINETQQQNQKYKKELFYYLCAKQNHDTQNYFYNARNPSKQTIYIKKYTL